MEGERARAAERTAPWIAALAVFAFVFACYWPALRGGMLWDDQAHVTTPELATWTGLGRIWSDLHATQQYYPVLHSAFWLEHRLWGEATLGYHLVNIFLHAGSACLLALILGRLWRSRAVGAGGQAPVMPAGSAWLAAALFAAHPVGVESVAWISEQKNTLSLFFYLLSALAYLRFVETRRLATYVGSLGLFVLALGTKSVTATLPAALLVILWWRNGRLSWRRDGLPLAPWFAIAIGAGLFTAWVERALIGASGAEFSLSAGQRLLLAGRVVWFYLGKLLWPADLMFVYPRWDVARQATHWYGWLLGVIAVTGGLWAIRRRWRGPLAGWLFFVGSLFPALGFFNVYPFLFSYVADHFQYLASIGFFATVAAGTAGLLAKASSAMRVAGWTAVGAVVGILGVSSHRESRMYRDAETLYRTTLARNPACWMAHNNLATHLAKTPGRQAEAIAHYEAALRLRPDYPEAHNNFGVELAKLPGRSADAIAQYQEAIRLQPDYAEAHGNLAVELAKTPGSQTEALTQYAAALRLKPDSAELHYNFGNFLADRPGHETEAVIEYERALQLDPGYAVAHYNLANVLATLPGRTPEAVEQYRAALLLDPSFANAHVALANLLAKIPDRLPEAVEHYEAAVRIDPNVAGVHYNLANALAALPNRMPEALAQYADALRLNPGYADAHAALAAQLARLPGRGPEAVAHYAEAVRLDPVRPGLHEALADTLSKLPGRESQAVLEYEAALRLEPDLASAHNNLAVLYARQHRMADARKHWEKALELDPNYEDARRNLTLLDRLEGR